MKSLILTFKPQLEGIPGDGASIVSEMPMLQHVEIVENLDMIMNDQLCQ